MVVVNQKKTYLSPPLNFNLISSKQLTISFFSNLIFLIHSSTFCPRSTYSPSRSLSSKSTVLELTIDTNVLTIYLYTNILIYKYTYYRYNDNVFQLVWFLINVVF